MIKKVATIIHSITEIAKISPGIKHDTLASAHSWDNLGNQKPDKTNGDLCSSVETKLKI